MSVFIFLVPASGGAELVAHLLHQEFGISLQNAKGLFKDYVKPHFDKLKDSIYLLAETNYVDKVYRDSYYYYYSSKRGCYKRGCVRISLFEGEIEATDFRNPGRYEGLRNQYRGFIVLRPTEPFVIGRSIISPQALKESNFLACTTKYETTVNGLKLEIEGFPHSSQDTETISCAETTLWAIMEYFGSKYREYKPVLPSRIIQTLNNVTSERQVPSKGLNVQQMSYALKEYGFGPRIYSRQEYKGDFESLLSCYVESGIPIIVAMENRHAGGDVGHALLCIGHEKITAEHIDALRTCEIMDNNLKDAIADKRIKLYDMDEIQKSFLFVDDNMPVYQKAMLEKPALHYDKSWQNCTISYFIVPLYQKIYLEAFEAKNFIRHFLTVGPAPVANDSELLIRYYLASSRTFKDNLLHNDSFDSELRELILEKEMPKFIWVAELSTKELIKQKKANGLMILDATEANLSFNKPLIIAAYEDRFISFEEETNRLENNVLSSFEFSIFERNLKVFQNNDR